MNKLTFSQQISRYFSCVFRTGYSHFVHTYSIPLCYNVGKQRRVGKITLPVQIGGLPMTRQELEVTEPNVIQHILENSKVLHLGLVDNGVPYVVPMNYGYKLESKRLTLYLHSAVRGYKLAVIAKNPVCCFEMECELTPFSGETACRYGMSYSSIIGRGKTVLVETGEEKKDALRLLMKTQTGKDFEFTDRQASAVSIIRIDVSEYTAKRHPLPPNSKEAAGKPV